MGITYESGDRRPIASREWKLSRVAASWLAAHGISPNAISVAGMIVGLAAGACLAGTAHAARGERVLWFIGAVFIQCRLLANMLDGMVAVEAKRASPLGELFNEVPDRVSDSAILIGFGLAAGGNVLLGIMAALTAMFTAYVRAVGRVAGAAQEFCGPMAKQQRMFLVTLIALYCAAVPRAWRIISGISIVEITLWLIIIGCVGTALRRLVRSGKALRARTP
jgi:phosphatidylglycerophosphate synthase